MFSLQRPFLNWIVNIRLSIIYLLCACRVQSVAPPLLVIINILNLIIFNTFLFIQCKLYTVFSLRAGSRRISPSIAVFFPAILFPTKIDRYFSRTSCTCFGIVFILVPYLIVCALARFSDLKRETSHYSI